MRKQENESQFCFPGGKGLPAFMGLRIVKQGSPRHGNHRERMPGKSVLIVQLHRLNWTTGLGLF